ncbi:MAG: hypothetical protein ACLR2G_12085 [Phascolarctobacterium faecium]
MLGFVGTDDNGLSGIELALDSVVRCGNTAAEVVDALGRLWVTAVSIKPDRRRWLQSI